MKMFTRAKRPYGTRALAGLMLPGPQLVLAIT
jgi:hypothetical protein